MANAIACCDSSWLKLPLDTIDGQQDKDQPVSFIDIFAWIVLLVLIASVVGVFVALGMIPGHIARKRNHPWAEAVAVGSWATLIFGFLFWPLVLIWAYVDTPTKTPPK